MATVQTGEPESTDGAARKKMRSPAFPFISLEVALGRAKEFYAQETRNAASMKVAVKHWGYAEKSSGGLQTVAALVAFGLVNDEGSGAKRKLQLSPMAIRILLDERPDSVERADLIKQAALSPKIHGELWRRWGPNLPSEQSLRYTLTAEWEPPFNENSVDAFIKEYKDTIAFAKLSESDTVSAEGGGQADQESPNDANSGLRKEYRHSKPPLKANMQESTLPLSEGQAVIQWPAQLSAESIQDLRDWLKIIERKIGRSETQRANPDEEQTP